jgi:hypothetical protein
MGEGVTLLERKKENLRVITKEMEEGRRKKKLHEHYSYNFDVLLEHIIGESENNKI